MESPCVYNIGRIRYSFLIAPMLPPVAPLAGGSHAQRPQSITLRFIHCIRFSLRLLKAVLLAYTLSTGKKENHTSLHTLPPYGWMLDFIDRYAQAAHIPISINKTKPNPTTQKKHYEKI